VCAERAIGKGEARQHGPPLQKTPQISTIFKADSVALDVSREKDGKSRLLYAGWDDTKVVQPDGCGQARRGWKSGFLPPGRESDDPLQKTRTPSGPPLVFPAIGAAHVHRTAHFPPSFLTPVVRNGPPPLCVTGPR
jgi:hypothetical protein